MAKEKSPESLTDAVPLLLSIRDGISISALSNTKLVSLDVAMGGPLVSRDDHLTTPRTNGHSTSHGHLHH